MKVSVVRGVCVECLTTGSEVVTVLVLVTLTPFIMSCPVDGTVILIRKSFSLFLIGIGVSGSAGVVSRRRGVGLTIVGAAFALTLLRSFFTFLSSYIGHLFVVPDINHIGFQGL